LLLKKIPNVAVQNYQVKRFPLEKLVL
jgi:hypothetical protein